MTAELVPDSPASEKTWELISVAIGTGDGGDSNLVELPDQRNTWKWVAGVAAALALIFGALLAVENLDASQLTGDSIIAAAEQFANDPGSIVGDFLVDEVSVAQVVLSADGQGFVIPTADLEPLDDARTYQLWVINDAEEVISAGVLGKNPEPATFTWTGDVTGSPSPGKWPAASFKRRRCRLGDRRRLKVLAGCRRAAEVPGASVPIAVSNNI